MEKKKCNIFLSLILILIVICLGIVLGTFVYFKVYPIEVPEISLLIEKIEIESKIVKVLVADENKVNSEIEINNNNNSQTSSSKNNTGAKKYSGGSSTSGAGGGVNVGPAVYTPKIQIPRTRINYTIFSEMTVRNMEKGVVILSTDNGLNEPGNTVISGHNYVNGRLFSNNDRIQLGDLIYITDSSGQKLTYSVYNKYLTDPNDASYMYRDTGGAREISLTTCTNDSSARIIIWAIEI